MIFSDISNSGSQAIFSVGLTGFESETKISLMEKARLKGIPDHFSERNQVFLLNTVCSARFALASLESGPGKRARLGRVQRDRVS